MFPLALLLACFIAVFSNSLTAISSPVAFVLDKECSAFPTQPSEQMDDLKVAQSASLVDVEGEPSAIIHGCVNAISGALCDMPVDLVAYNGIDSFPIGRTWCGSTDVGSDLHGGWNFNLGGFATYAKCKRKGDKEKVYVMAATGDNGGVVYYSLSQSRDKATNPFTVDKISLEKGVTNTAQGIASGQNNLRNRKFTLTDKKNTVLTLGSGERRYYEPDSTRSDGYIRIRDELPSGSSIKYWYEKYGSENEIDRIGFNSKTVCWQTLTMTPKKEVKKAKQFTFKLDKNRSVKYSLNEHKLYKGFWLIASAESTDYPKVTYEHSYSRHLIGDFEDVENGYLSKKGYPDGRYLDIEYFHYGENSLLNPHDNRIGDGRSPLIGRVQKLCAPAGPGNSRVPIYYFYYDVCIETDKKDKKKREVKHGMTSVFDAHRRKTGYEFNADQRLIGIRKYLDNGSIYTNETFVWGANDTKESTYLLSRQFKGPDDATIFARTYAYDTNGNTIEDAFYGNLSGNSTVAPRIEGKAEKNGAEGYKKTYTYSTDGYNVPLEEHDGSNRTIFKYAPNSNKLVAKFQGNFTRWYKRWFYKYNDDGAIVEEVCDDGYSEDYDNLSGVTQRKIVISEQRTSYPVAYPDKIEEYFLDVATNTKLLNKRVVNTYNDIARITKQQHYGSDGALAYTLEWSYDAHGNVTQEIDAIGRIITRKYDSNDNCIYEKGPRHDCHKEFIYDAMNRLIREDLVHNDGIRRTTIHNYDIASNKTSTIDPNGSETKYAYDELKRAVQTTLPIVADEKGTLKNPVTKQSYTPMGRVSKVTDANGNTTATTYNIRGQPVLTTHPDGSTEKSVYNLNGTLNEKTEKNGASTRYTYDPLGRILRTDVLGSHGGIVKSYSATYSGFNILTETDPMGTVTSYSYYPNGLLKTKSIGDKVTSYQYDSLGRQQEIIEIYGIGPNDCLIRKFAYDKLGRIIDEKSCGPNGDIHTHTSYRYDHGGNLNEVHVHTQTGTHITVTEYDSHGVPVTVTDPLGNVTQTICKYDYRNENGQIVGYKEIVDPEGHTTVVIQDALGRPAKAIKKDPFGKITEQKELVYDLNGNCLRIVDKIFNKGSTKEVVTATIYDSMGRPTKTYQAFGLPEQKVTSFAYNTAGSKIKTEKFDGTTIVNKHDYLERVQSVTSSDNTVDYTYSYDVNDNVTYIQDKTNNTATRKFYDLYNYLVKEILGNGQSIAYTNDLLGRIRRIDLSDKTAIAYDYDGTQLKTIRRVDEKGRDLYEHSYDTYDTNGKVTEATLAGGVESIKYQYDPCGRIIAIESSDWKETIDGYDKAGNITARTAVTEGNKESYKYTYDSLYQLVAEEGPTTHTYSYDSHYNRLTKDGAACTYNALDLLINDGTNTYSYDLNGNLKRKNSDIAYAYDAFDRLIAVTQGTDKTIYQYDASHRRLSKTSYENVGGKFVQTDKVNYLYQGQNEIGATDVKGVITELRLLGIGKGAEIGASVAIEINKTMYVPLHDHNGNLAAILDGSSGALVESYSYSAFGEYDGDAISPWLFSSKRHDPETGFVYYGRRYYDPNTARWITEDPLGREAGPNRYAFVHNNPLTHVDLYGLVGQGSFSYMDSFGRSMNRLYNGISMITRFAACLPGNIIEIAGTHLLPIPYVNTGVAFIGHCLAGKPPGDYTSNKNNCGSKIITHEGYGELNPLAALNFYNGMNQSEADVRRILATISASYGGRTAHCIYNANHGTILDCIEYVCQRAGIPTHAQEVAENFSRLQLSEMDKIGPGGIIEAFAYSQGAETVHNLSHEVKKRMNVTGLGPARVLNPDNFYDAHNFVSPRDPITRFADSDGYHHGIKNGYLTIVAPYGYSPLDNHGIESPPYAKVIQWLGRDYKNKTGSVEDMGKQ